MTELKIRPLPVDESHESFVPSDDAGFVDESVVRQMILDGEPDELPRTGNPALPNPFDRRQAPYPLAFAS